VRSRRIGDARRLLVWAAGRDELHRNVRRVSIARLISTSGNQAAIIALMAAVYQRTNHSGVWLGAALLASFSVRVLAGPWVGALGDHFDRRTVMVSSDIAAAVAFVGLAFAHAPLALALVGLAVVAAIAEAPFGAASSAQFAMLVPGEERAWAASMRSAVVGGGILLGGIAGGALVAAFGPSVAFLVNAVSFLISAAIAVRISGGPYRAQRSAEPAHRGVWAGVRLISSERALRFSVATISLGFLGAGMLNLAEYPLFVKIGGGSFAFGIAAAGWGLGQIVGGRSLKRAHNAALERRMLIGGQLVMGIAIVASGVIPFAPVVVVLFAVIGFGNAVSLAAASLVIQRWTPDPVRARVFGAYDSVSSAAIGLAIATAGIGLAALGPRGVFVLGGAIALVSVLAARQVPPRRQPLNKTPTSEQAAAPVDPRVLPLVPIYA
jgi:MFS family permease